MTLAASHTTPRSRYDTALQDHAAPSFCHQVSPQNPGQVQVTGLQAMQADVKWTRAAGVPEGAKVVYKVLLSDSPGRGFERVGITERRHWRLVGLQPNTQYQVTILTKACATSCAGAARC